MPFASSLLGASVQPLAGLECLYGRELDNRVATETPAQQASLRRAFERHYLPTLRLCLLLSGRREEAEDIAQEAFVRLAPKIAALEEPAIGPFVRRIAINVWKNRNRRFRVELRARDLLRLPSGGWPPAEDRDAVWEAIKRLPSRQRACLALRYYEDLSERETAAVLGCSVGTVKSQTSRALARLRMAAGLCSPRPIQMLPACT
jgi:RNA polymerase sigma factor (sigma-70 family)